MIVFIVEMVAVMAAAAGGMLLGAYLLAKMPNGPEGDA